MADLANAPQALQELYRWLFSQGFGKVEDVPGDSFNQYVVLARDERQVAIRSDRGEWDITISVDDGFTFWQVDQLMAYLDDRPWIGEPSSAEQRCVFVRSRFDELRDRLLQDPRAIEALYLLGDQWMSWRFGIPIPDGGFPGRKSR